MFSRAFLETPASQIVEELRERGYMAFERALDAGVADAILADVDDLKFEINRNVPPNVVIGGQTYANHVFARSRSAFEVVVHERVTGVLREGLGDGFRMVGKRVYETRADHYMQFHSDTAVQPGDPRRLDAVVFIFYLNDVAQGEWEIVEGSHLWGETTVGSRANDEALLARPDVTVRRFAMPKGSLIVYNGRVLHRARRFKDPGFARRSFFFQVNRQPKSSEPMLIDAGFIRPDLSEDARMLLGFGKPAVIPPYPASSPQSLPLGRYPELDRYLAEHLTAGPRT
jgi:ectoine hydroxylase-related dioxygenase (phytanoyl-CoA dioxygenase family)